MAGASSQVRMPRTSASSGALHEGHHQHSGISDNYWPDAPPSSDLTILEPSEGAVLLQSSLSQGTLLVRARVEKKEAAELLHNLKDQIVAVRATIPRPTEPHAHHCRRPDD